MCEWADRCSSKVEEDEFARLSSVLGKCFGIFPFPFQANYIGWDQFSFLLLQKENYTQTKVIVQLPGMFP